MSLSNFATVKILTVADGGSLVALKQKGNLTHVETLYNPNNFFSEVHILVFKREDLTVLLKNPTLKVHYLNHWPKNKLGLIFSFPFLLYQVIKIIKKYEIKIIRSRNAYFAGLIGIFAGRLAKIPTIISLGGDNRLAQSLLGYYYGGHRFISHFLEEFSLRRATAVFCVNRFTQNYAIRLGVETMKTKIIPHRLDINLDNYRYNRVLARKELGFNNEPIILIVARLERDKQVDLVVEAVPFVKEMYPKVKFVFIGDGDLRDLLDERAKALSVSNVIDFVGFKPRKEVVKYLSAATIVCVPMSGFVIYEAAAAMRPIVAFDIEWHSEFIEDGITGILVENGDVPRLANALKLLLENFTFASELAKNARKKLLTEFNNEKLIMKELEAYFEVLS